jgi:cytoplasmic iron level regulating protein YaaA (DUF328/UPF0246 family)
MPRINEHNFLLDQQEYKLTYFRGEAPKIFKNGVMYVGNKSDILRRYLLLLGVDEHLTNKKTTQQLADLVLKNVSRIFDATGEKNKVASASKKVIEPLVKVKKQKSDFENGNVEQIQELINSLNIAEIKAKEKLLIIGCSDSKVRDGSELDCRDYFIENINRQTELCQSRETRFKQYEYLLETNKNYFIIKDPKKQTRIKRNGRSVEMDYFYNCKNNEGYLPAYQRYNGFFYSQELRDLYEQANAFSNLHILIISGLYGVLDFRDSIVDYHLKISKQPLWTKKENYTIQNAVNQYLLDNNIQGDMVYYSLSDEYLMALKPVTCWKNIWVKGNKNSKSANLYYSADYLKILLRRII